MPTEVYQKALEWAKVYDKELEEMLQDEKYALKVLGIERGNTKPRKDISKWSEVKNAIIYLYDDKFEKIHVDYHDIKVANKEEMAKILVLYCEKYFDINDEKQVWFNKIKDLAEEIGYAREVKEYKQ